jgi:hypothetical protein
MMKRLTDGTGTGPEDERTSDDPEVHSITTAALSHSEDMHKRMVRYATAMGIRMVCIVLLLVVDGWFKLLAIAGAVFLPWVAVIIANAQDKAETTSSALLDVPPPAELEGGKGKSDEDDVVLTGEVVDDAETQDREAETQHRHDGRKDKDWGTEEKSA